MSLLTNQRSLESELPEGVSAIEKAREHARLEIANDVPTILPTISKWDTNFVVLKLEGENGPEFSQTVFEYDAGDWGVEPYYYWQESQIFRLRQDFLVRIPTRWYEFTDATADLTSRETGEPVPCHVAVLFPTWSDGIIGEIAFGIPSWGYQALDEDGYRTVSKQFAAYNDAWRSGDLDARLATFDDKTLSVIRIVAIDSDRRHRAIAHSKDELRAAWAAPAEGRVLELELVNQVVTSWYIFGGYKALLELPDGQKVERETARMFAVGPNRTFISELTYSLEIAV
jgi:hypothetical protein